ncbi:cation-translocating P-type ATPase [Aminipila sp.]|uniref:cation-translocating P-type ATPase n=1 Tax=Aminipila sp. TaxID=2060095 RepID=UPI00289CE5B4|nr:cation-translocating P-type ATPase [Aminipila sp.]
MKKYELMSVEEVLNDLKTGKDGLNRQQIAQNKEQFGENKLPEEKSVPPIIVFFSQFKDFLVIILIAAALISAAMGKFESTMVIIAVLILNAVLGTVQHIKAEQSLKSLKTLSSPKAKVIRNGEKIEIPSAEVVVGDLLVLDAGDYVSADCRVIESFSLQTNESALTGESLSVEKYTQPLDSEKTALGDQINRVFSSSYVTYGRGLAVVTSVGKDTEIGKIAGLIASAKEKATPLQQSLDAFGKKLAILILAITVLVFALSLYRQSPVMDALMFAISLAVAAIPEALSSIVTIVLALGTRKLASENAIIRKLHSVESLGSISVICSDKTGTLTQNKMTVQQIYLDHTLVNASEANIEDPLTDKLILAGLLCSDAVTSEDKSIGDPTEIALLDFAEKYDRDELIVRSQFPRISELPFDSDRKLMTTHHELDDIPVAFTKGALDVILRRATHIETAEGVRPIQEEDIQAYEKVNFELSNSGLRVLAFAWKEMNGENLEMQDEYNLILLGIISMMDPPREDSAQAVADCIQAGIKPVMITGDHKITAAAIARQIGILSKDDQVIEGADIEDLSDEELEALVPHVAVYARVSPEHKIRIVSAWQALGNVVAMTGDGVNDAPALKKADVGVAMGITGTEVSKDAASMVLTDDRFATIVKAINNGRSIYGNIKNAVKFLLSGNTAGIIAVLYASLSGLPAPFAPVHLLFINLLTDSLPAIAIGVEPAHGELMKDKPRDVSKPIMDRRFAIEVLLQGIVIAIVTMTAYHIGTEAAGHETGMTMAFATLSLARLVHGFNCRTDAPLSLKTFFMNKFSFMAFFAGTLLLSAVLVLEPLHKLFEVADLTGNQMAIIGILAFVPLVVVQAVKRIIKR